MNPDPDEAPVLELTGERTLPGIADETYWYERHVVAYELAATHVEGRTVLDAGCGEGYGLRMLRDAGATRVLGADLDEPVIAHVQATYGSDAAIEAVACELMSLPLEDDEVDVTVSFQVIEHLHDIPGYLRSLVRVTRPGGLVLIATPNRLTFTPDSDVPVNPFHTREFTGDELDAELRAAGLQVEQMLGVHHGSALRALEFLARSPFTDLVTRPANDWPRWLRTVVHRVRAAHFDVRADAINDSLDLIAICRVPAA